MARQPIGTFFAMKDFARSTTSALVRLSFLSALLSWLLTWASCRSMLINMPVVLLSLWVVHCCTDFRVEVCWNVATSRFCMTVRRAQPQAEVRAGTRRFSSDAKLPTHAKAPDDTSSSLYPAKVQQANPPKAVVTAWNELRDHIISEFVTELWCAKKKEGRPSVFFHFDNNL